MSISSDHSTRLNHSTIKCSFSLYFLQETVFLNSTLMACQWLTVPFDWRWLITAVNRLRWRETAAAYGSTVYPLEELPALLHDPQAVFKGPSQRWKRFSGSRVTAIDPLTHDDEITVQWLAKNCTPLQFFCS